MSTTTDSTPSQAGKSIRDVWRVLLVEGIVLLLLGAGALMIPEIASIAAAVLLGWLFLIGGAVGLTTTIVGRNAPGFLWALLSSLVTIGAGLFLLIWPLSGVISLTLVLAAYLAADGVVSIFFAIDHRRQMTHRWGWLMFNGLIDLVMAAIIVLVLGQSALWVLGILIGVDFLFGGASLIAIALAARNPPRN